MTGGGLGGGRPGLNDPSWGCCGTAGRPWRQWPEGLAQCAALGDPLVAVPPGCDAVYRSGKRGLNTEAGPNRNEVCGTAPCHPRGSCDSRPPGGAVGPGKAARWGARGPHRKWRLVRADGGGCGDDGGGLRRGWGGSLPLPLPRLPGGRAARGLRGRRLRGARHRRPDVSPASGPGPGAGPRLAGERADRWAGPGALGTGEPRGTQAGRDSGRRGPLCTTRGHLGFSVSKSEPRLHTSRLERSPARGLATQTSQPCKPRLDCA